MSVLALCLTVVAADSWELVRDTPHATVERRTHDGGFYEIRVSLVTDVPGAWVADAYWNERDKTLSTLKKYEVLKRTDEEKIAYLQLHLPVIKDRDYTIRIAREANVAEGFYQFRGRCVSDVGPPPDADFVRVTQCTAELTIEPADNGQTRLTYVAYANPAGQVPKWLANTLAPRAAVEVLDKLVTLARGAGAVLVAK